MCVMKQIQHPELLSSIDAFLASTQMGETYFGKQAVGNSEIVARLRKGGFVSPVTEKRVLEFISTARKQGSGATQ